ncbi:MAG: carboxypeptidase-like regulatory domain-containing protein, partial [Planctomycetota bacterium]
IEYGARARGHGPRHDRLRLDPGQAAALDVTLPAACTLSGSATDRDGAPVAARIVAGGPDTFTSVRGTADADGRFVLPDLAPGETPVLARGAAGMRAAATLALQPGENHWQAVLADPATDANLRGVLVDRHGQPLAGHRVQVRPGRGPAPSTTTGQDGTFALRVADGVLVDLRVYAPGQQVTGFAAGVFRDVDPARGQHRLELLPVSGGSITGRIETAGHVGVPASVTCWHHERAERVRLLATTDGTIAFAAVPAGTLDLLCEHPGHAGAARRDLSLPPFGRLDLGLIVLGSGGALSGTVRGPGGTTPEHCQLTVLAQDQQRFHADYSGGAYRFPTLPAGNHTLLVQAAGLAAVSFAIDVGANTEKVQDVELRAGVARRFRVVIPREAPGHCALAIRPPGQTMQWLATGGGQRPDDQAALAIEFVACMVPGAYEAVAWAAGGWEARLPVVFTAADDSEVVLTLRRQ